MDSSQWKKVFNQVHAPSNSSVRNLISIIKKGLCKQNKSVFEEWFDNRCRADHKFNTTFTGSNYIINLTTTLPHIAAYHGYLDIVKYFVSKRRATIKLKDDNGNIPLHMATLNGCLDIVKYLVDKKKVAPDVKNNNGDTPLHNASIGGHLDTVKYLVDKKKVAPDVKNNNGDTPLHMATLNGCLDIVKYLVDKKKVAPDVKNNNGSTPLYNAIVSGSLQVFQYLVDEKNVVLDVKNNDVDDLYNTAMRRGYKEIAEYLASLKKFASYVKNNDVDNSLCIADKNVSSETTELLVDKEVVPYVKNNYKYAPSSGKNVCTEKEIRGSTYELISNNYKEVKMPNSTQHTKVLEKEKENLNPNIMKQVDNQPNQGPVKLPVNVYRFTRSCQTNYNPVLQSQKQIKGSGGKTGKGNEEVGSKDVQSSKKNKRVPFSSQKLSNGRRSLTEKIENLQHLDVKTSEVTKLAEEKSQLEDNLNGVKRNLDAKTSELTSTKTQLEKLQQELAEKTEELQVGKAHLAEKEKELNHANQRVSQLEQEQNVTKQQLEELKSKNENKIQELRNKIQQLEVFESKNNDLKTKMQKSESKSKELESQINDLQKQLESKNKELEGKDKKSLIINVQGAKGKINYASVSFVLSGAFAVGASLTIPYLTICIPLAIAAFIFLATGCYCSYKANTALSNVEVDQVLKYPDCIVSQNSV